MECKGSFIPILFGNISTCQSQLLLSNVKKIVATPRRSQDSSMKGTKYESWIFSVFHSWFSMQKRSVTFFLDTKTIGEAQSACSGLTPSKERFQYIFCFWNSLAVGSAQNGAEWTGRLSVFTRSIPCRTLLVDPKVSVSLTFELCKHVNEFVGICGIIVWKFTIFAPKGLDNFVWFL